MQTYILIQFRLFWILCKNWVHWRSCPSIHSHNWSTKPLNGVWINLVFWGPYWKLLVENNFGLCWSKIITWSSVSTFLFSHTQLIIWRTDMRSSKIQTSSFTTFIWSISWYSEYLTEVQTLNLWSKSKTPVHSYCTPGVGKIWCTHTMIYFTGSHTTASYRWTYVIQFFFLGVDWAESTWYIGHCLDYCTSPRW
jgi:hypothetical protein